MTDFNFEDCLLKHHVRVNGWLPRCRRRLQIVRGAGPQKALRRLRYFTFCAVGAIDVLMLDVAKVLVRSTGGEFDTVSFFNHDGELVKETRKRIPGAVGFVGDFIPTILSLSLVDEHQDLVSVTEDVLAEHQRQALEPPREKQNTRFERDVERMRAEGLRFLQRFPFDVINLDLEELFFKPNDPFPGKVVAALRRICDWQRRPLDGRTLDGFTLMFTTQIGPLNMSDDYRTMLRDVLRDNVREQPHLLEMMEQRTGFSDIDALADGDFENFFKLAVPKIIASILLGADWYVDPQQGVTIFEFERSSKSGPYKILHLAIDALRQSPRIERRTPAEHIAPAAQEAYRSVAAAIFSNPEEVVTDATVDGEALQDSLDKIRARRRKYFPDG